MITETTIQVTDIDAMAGWTRKQRLDARRAGTTPTIDETRYIISGTIESMTQDHAGFHYVIDGTRVTSVSQPLYRTGEHTLDDGTVVTSDTLIAREGDTIEVTARMTSNGHMASKWA